jgi:hypothetical protein
MRVATICLALVFHSSSKFPLSDQFLLLRRDCEFYAITTLRVKHVGSLPWSSTTYQKETIDPSNRDFQ